MADPKNETGVDTVDADVGNVWEKVDTIVDGFFTILPNIGLAVLFFAAMYGLAHLVEKFFRRGAKKRGRDNLGEVMGRLLRWTILVIAFMFAVTIVAPSVKPVDLLGALGVGSVAIGFAFKDILQNLLAGVLILIRQPFEVGDQISAEGFEGTVERIETRATILRTYDGRRVVVPNAEIYTDTVVVNTAHDKRRSEYDVGIGYGDDIGEAVEAMIQAMKGIDDVIGDPAPEVIVVDLAGSSVNLRARWWTKPDQATHIHTFGNVLTAIKQKLDERGIDMPYPTEVHLWHDQTEASDGDRTAQREGWPAGDNPPESARISKAIGGGQQAEGGDDNNASSKAGRLGSPSA